MSDDVIIEQQGRGGRMRLNRPKAIHALNLTMCTAMLAALQRWEQDNSVDVILLDHSEGRGFCAGGDIRMLAESGASDGVAARQFFHTEYQLNHKLFIYPKPVIAFMDGITMGGGVGISAPARYRIATENTRLAMPETGIGLFPDGGGGWHLSRLEGRVGVFLALTGARLDGAECKELGLATHYVAADNLEAIKAEIIAEPEWTDNILAKYNEVAPEARIVSNIPIINRLFAGGTVEEIMAALEADDSDWAHKELATLRTKSPKSMKVSLRLVEEGASLTDFADEMRKEYAIGGRVVMRHDFIEGVRALIVDKDNAPKWSPSSPQEVSDETIDAIFAPLPKPEEWKPA